MLFGIYWYTRYIYFFFFSSYYIETMTSNLMTSWISRSVDNSFPHKAIIHTSLHLHLWALTFFHGVLCQIGALQHLSLLFSFLWKKKRAPNVIFCVLQEKDTHSVLKWNEGQWNDRLFIFDWTTRCIVYKHLDIKHVLVTLRKRTSGISVQFSHFPKAGDAEIVHRAHFLTSQLK